MKVVVVGYACGGQERTNHPIYKGELYAIYVLDTYQKNGFGRQLFSSIVQPLSVLNYRSLLVWVLEENPARYFYETLGGKQVDSKIIQIGGTNLVEIGYGWDDTKVI